MNTKGYLKKQGLPKLPRVTYTKERCIKCTRLQDLQANNSSDLRHYMDKVVYLSKTVKEYSFKDKQLFIQTLNTIESLSKFANTMYLAQLLPALFLRQHKPRSRLAFHPAL